MKNYFLLLIGISFSLLLISGCATSGRISKSNISPKNISKENNFIRVLLDNRNSEMAFAIQSPVILYEENSPVAVIKRGNVVKFSGNGNSLNLNISDKNFEAKYFQLKPDNDIGVVEFKNHKYRGIIKLICNGNSVAVINEVSLEDYIRGVIPAEMPLGKGDEYLEALKAFAVCARTYAVSRLNKSHSFDVYLDTRDQVYDGFRKAPNIINRAVDETKGMILTYDDQPATVFYSASCGGHTSNVKDVFTGNNEPYLQGVEDGDPPNCSIAPNFNWTETYSSQEFISRLKSSGYLGEESYILQNVYVENRNSSGRVEDLLIVLSKGSGEKKINIPGNKIRTAIHNQDNGNILRSTMFEISFNGNQVIIRGKGNGHGVGLCQWGAISQSIKGRDYKQILSFYFPGTTIGKINDSK